MNNTEEQREIAPQISEMASNAIIRLAWALNCNVHQVFEEMVAFISQPQINHNVCRACKDRTICKTCIFNNINTPQSALSNFIKGMKYNDFASF